MRINEVINEDLSRRGFLKGLGAAAAAGALPKIAKANEPDEEDIYYGSRKDFETKPRKLYPSVAVNKPNQYVKQMDLVVYDGNIFNQMNLQDFIKLKREVQVPDVEVLPANTIPGINDKVYLTQMGNYNYFATQEQVNTFAEQYRVEMLVKRNYDIKQRMARGDWGQTEKGISKQPPPMQHNLDSVQKPLYPWEKETKRNI